MNLRIFSILIVFAMLFSPSQLWSQKKVLGSPSNFKKPGDYFANEDNYIKFITDKTSPKSRKEGWFVFSDREENIVYNKPNGSKSGSIDFRDHFYVVEEKGAWIKLINARVDELKIVEKVAEVGWIEKKNMLIWPRGIVDQRTSINKKVLLLNKADEIERILKGEKDLVEVYASPTSTSKLENKKIFEYFFVLKKENGRVLVAAEAELGRFNKDKIIGWIDSRDCTEWNSRVCLEPNFTSAGFREREQNKKYQLKGYKSLIGAVDNAAGRGRGSEVFWASDPVNIKKSLMASSDPNRYLGSIIRFPMVSLESKDNIDYFQSGVVGKIRLADKDGVIGTMDGTVYSKLKDYKDKLVHKAKNVNIFFVIEGTESVAPYKKQIIDGIKDIYRENYGEAEQIRYGALVYRDIPEERGNGITEHIRLTPHFDQVTSFLEKTAFQNTYDRDEYTALYYGLNKALTVGGFNDQDLNIIMILGNYGDLKTNKSRRLQAQQSGSEALIMDSEPIIENLNSIGAHLYSIQLKNDGSRTAKSFTAIGQHLMLETGKYAFNSGYGSPAGRTMLKELVKKSKVQISVPTMDDEGQARIPLEGASVLAATHRPANGQFLSLADVKKAMKNEISSSTEFISNLKKVVANLVDSGDNLPDAIEGNPRAAGRLTPALASWLYEILKDRDVEVDNLLETKLRLFTEVYFPREIPGANHPSISYVLFMPENDLRDYQQTIKRCIVTGGSYDKKRESLFEVYKKLIEEFTGGMQSQKRFTRSDLIAQMQGVAMMGLELEDPLDHAIPDILDSKKVKDKQVDAIIDRFAKVNGFLEKVLRDGDAYDFCYATDDINRYYWIPLSEIF